MDCGLVVLKMSLYKLLSIGQPQKEENYFIINSI